MALPNLNIASGAHVKTALLGLKPHFNSEACWVRNSNRYIDDTIRKLNADKNAGTVHHQDAIDYVASSVFVHAHNGWNYLSSAVSAFLDADYPNCIHNAYYAELRATMSFLASQGIGVFNGNNILVTAHGGTDFAQGTYSELRTHSFAKLALEQWLNDSINASNILSVVKVGGRSIGEWIDATGFNRASHLPGMLASGWIREWSFDVGRIKDDQDLRNIVSYRPQRFNQSHLGTFERISDRIQFVDQLWQLVKPGNLFDRSLWRISLEYYYKSLFGITDLSSELSRVNDIEKLFQDAGVPSSSTTSQVLIDFLTRTDGIAENDLFSLARTSIRPIGEGTIEPLGVLSRAALLLNFSTREAQNLFQNLRVSKNDVKFWTDNVGVRTGLWEPGNEPTLFSDLWEDVELELDEIRRWRNGRVNPIIHDQQYFFRRNLKPYMSHLRQFNRAFLWNLGLD